MSRTTTLALCALIAVALRAPAPTALAGDAPPTGGPVAAGRQTTVTPLLGPDGISWRTFEALQVAVREMARKGHRIAECRIHAWEQGDRLSVSFAPPRSLDPPWSNDGTITFGCPPGPCSCWVVDLAPADLRVLASHGIR